MGIKRLILKPGREKSVLQKHPWIYSGAIEKVEGKPEPGETVAIYSSQGQWLAWAGYSPRSSIRARIWSWDVNEAIRPEFFEGRIAKAISRRWHLQNDSSTTAYRLIHAESDGLPGLIVDRYRDWLVVQILTVTMEVWRDVIFKSLRQSTGFDHIYERSDVEVRSLEGLTSRVGPCGETLPPPVVEIQENGHRFWVDIQHGQKTGFYLDQRENRRIVGHLAAGKEVLNAFCYTGAFSVYTLAGGAKSVCSIDVSGEALRLAQENLKLNGFDPEQHEWVEGDVFQVLRHFRDVGRKFDLIILDPPKFAPATAQIARAARGYKDINWLAFRLLRPGGLLVTFSCSGGVTPELFQKIVADAALDAGVEGRILMRLYQASDHPVALNFPEGLYLKGLVVEI
ncbi:class I SAM-dependent rRNA methyltransferase [Thermanaerothrix sp. 4228-RoL]|uniref:Class I SAM-dependent rRNA methyltransferase n=1 Tax=Thermanaerothrix solaris TaxID=3058434 RepID=A0ABU3NJ80_9CHLR|nr:class I SAM-dependent rRNA methyltransferase [Thermanaerothrix sp. 4228-RoL]MDT8896904.1 class I SAM-dependent rRNA methyltransferase [Thermanaerothrix sp. 4228-RoL]